LIHALEPGSEHFNDSFSMGGRSSKPSNTRKSTTHAAPGKITEIDRAMLDLKNTRDRLQKYRNRLSLEEAQLVERARQAKDRGHTQQALGLLRLKKYKNVTMDQVEQKLLTVLQMVETIDSKQNEKEFLNALRSGKDALAQMQKETTVEDVLQLMEQIQEQNDVEKEVAEILSNVPTLSAVDEATVEAELLALQSSVQVEGNDELNLPAVPTSKLPKWKNDLRSEADPAPNQSAGNRIAVAS
jgi:charged multivesicular body protein 6